MLELIGNKNGASLQDTSEFLGLLTKLASDQDSLAQQLHFNWASDVVVARAPGRLDVMGGIADYSGSLVLQMPIAEACHVALQIQTHAADAEPQAKKGRTTPQLRIVSLHADEAHRSPSYSIDLGELFPGGQPLEYDQARALFKADPRSSWAAYIAGCLLVLAREKGVKFGNASVSILVSSHVPEGKGVSSSAAVEVATMCALLGAVGVALEGREVAILCQMVENRVVGAPCGIMDQMASALGQQGQLLALLCQPAEVQGCVPLPAHVRVWGVDSGIRHSVGGSDYGSVRVGAFMGLRIASEVEAGGKASQPLRGGYLVHVSPSEYVEWLEQQLPVEMGGEEFLERYSTHFDSVTAVNPKQRYSVRTPAAHPIHEHHRVAAFRQTLLAPPGPQQLEVLGEMMMQSHASYGACKLGSEGTDRLVALVRQQMSEARAAGRRPVLYGAKITGGGCGGTVCILGDASDEAEAAVERVVAAYAAERDAGSGSSAPLKVFRGSSQGAHSFGHVVVRLKQA